MDAINLLKVLKFIDENSPKRIDHDSGVDMVVMEHAIFNGLITAAPHVPLRTGLKSFIGPRLTDLGKSTMNRIKDDQKITSKLLRFLMKTKIYILSILGFFAVLIALLSDLKTLIN